MPRDDVLTTGPAAAYLGLHVETLRSWAKTGRVPHSVTPTGRLHFKRSDLDTFIRHVEPTAVKAS